MQRIIAAIAFAVIFSSCANKSENDLTVLKAAQEGLEQSNKTILHSTERIYKALEDKLKKPETAQQAVIWQPKATEVNYRTKNVINYVEELIKKLHEDEKKDAVKDLFFDEKKGDELYDKLKEYKRAILAVDPEIFKQFSPNAIIITQAFEADSNRPKDFTKTFFYKQPSESALLTLTKFENNVRILENQLVNFCHSKIGTVGGWNFMTTTPFVNQSSNDLKGGSEMEIIAGVGAFNPQAQPKITINGVAIVFDISQGLARYKFKTPTKKGQYTVPVNIKFIDENGRLMSVDKKIEYIVEE